MTRKHWLADRLDALHELSDRYALLQERLDEGEVSEVAPQARAAQRALTQEAEELARAISARLETGTCAVSHEGFVVTGYGPGSWDTLAACADSALEWAATNPLPLVPGALASGCPSTSRRATAWAPWLTSSPAPPPRSAGWRSSVRA